jgi:hypothetical protein
VNRAGLRLNPTKSYLTLTSCHPRFSARERIVILAELIDNSNRPGDAPESERAVGTVRFRGQQRTPDAAALQEGLEGDPSSRVPAILTALVVLVVGMVWWWAFRRYRHPLTWVAGALPFAAVLFVFYVYLERMLPAGY